MRARMTRSARVVAVGALVVGLTGAMSAAASADGARNTTAGVERFGFGDTWVHEIDPDERLGFGDSLTEPRPAVGNSGLEKPPGLQPIAREPAAQPGTVKGVVIVLAMLALVIGSATVAARATATRRRKVAVVE